MYELSDEEIKRGQAERIAQGFDPDMLDPAGIPALVRHLDLPLDVDTSGVKRRAS